MNREEREEYVVQLYKENNSIREIARLVHMSFRDIGVIINKAKLQAERERGYAAEDTQPKSPESQAFKLFSEGKSPIEVAIDSLEGVKQVEIFHPINIRYSHTRLIKEIDKRLVGELMTKGNIINKIKH
jgi:transposase